MVISIWLLHRNEKFWTNPDTFDPDRWCATRLDMAIAGPWMGL